MVHVPKNTAPITFRDKLKSNPFFLHPAFQFNGSTFPHLKLENVKLHWNRSHLPILLAMGPPMRAPKHPPMRKMETTKDQSRFSGVSSITVPYV